MTETNQEVLLLIQGQGSKLIATLRSSTALAPDVAAIKVVDKGILVPDEIYEAKKGDYDSLFPGLISVSSSSISLVKEGEQEAEKSNKRTPDKKKRRRDRGFPVEANHLGSDKFDPSIEILEEVSFDVSKDDVTKEVQEEETDES